jgi:hypothetical protein
VAAAPHGSSAARGSVQRITAFKVKMELQDKDEKYWELYRKWFEVQGQEKVTSLLEPLENIEQVRKMLDEFSGSKSMELSSAELLHLGMVRDYGDKAVFKALTAGIDVSSAPETQLGRLLQNFVTAGPTHFDYTMASLDKTKFLGGTVGGDCNTVVHTFEWIAQDYLGIPTSYKTSADVGFTTRFIAPRAKTIDGKTGNVDGGAFWLFDNHYWVEAGGKKYDVLFGREGVDTGSWVKETGHTDNPSVFGDRQIWATGKVTPLGARYSTSPP